MTKVRKMIETDWRNGKRFYKNALLHRTFLKKTGFYFTVRKKAKVICLLKVALSQKILKNFQYKYSKSLSSAENLNLPPETVTLWCQLLVGLRQQ